MEQTFLVHNNGNSPLDEYNIRQDIGFISCYVLIECRTLF